jgi:hypothetical protein
LNCSIELNRGCVMRITKLDEVIDKVANREGYCFTYFDREQQNYVCFSPLTSIEGKGATSMEAFNSLRQQLLDIRLSQNRPVKQNTNRVTITERRGLRAIKLLEEMANGSQLKPYEVLELLIYSKYVELKQAPQKADNCIN